MTDIFVSYASEDRERVRPLVSMLEELGHSIWWDRHIEAGEEFDLSIEKAIDEALCMIVVWSENSVSSEWVRTEAMEGMDRKILCPVQIDDIRPPLAFRRIQTAQLIEWPGRPCTDEVSRMLTSIQQMLGEIIKKPVEGITPQSGRRNITHLSGRIRGFDKALKELDPEDIEQLINQMRNEVNSAIENCGGLLNQFTGSTVQAVFGVPVSHEDDALRAISAARQMQEQFKVNRDYLELGLELCIGVASGQVIAHGINRNDNSFELLGTCIELSTTLAYNCGPGRIFVCPKTKRLAQSYFQFETSEEYPEASIVIDTLGDQTKSWNFNTHLTEFCGRDGELAILEQAVERVREGLGQVVCVIGDAGTGKSRLVREFQMRLEENNVRLIRARCNSHGVEIYKPIQQLLKGTLDLQVDTDSSADFVAAITDLHGGSTVHVGALLDILEIDDPVHALPMHLESLQKQAMHRDAVTATIARLSEVHTTVIVLDDWHWSDDMSDAALLELIISSHTAPLMLVVAHRPEYEPVWHNQPNVSVLKLQPLSSNASATVLSSVFGVSEVPEDLCSTVHARTGGNPFFLEELGKSLLEEGQLRVVGDRLEVLEQPAHQALPTSVHTVIRSRLDQLDSFSARVVDTASAMGREFSYELLNALIPEEEKLDSGLRTLINSSLILQTSVIPERQYKFKHVLTQAVAYDSLLSSDQRSLHREIAQAIEILYSEKIDTHTARLALHYEKSGIWPKAIEYLIRAGYAARKLSACDQAIEYFQRALDLLSLESDSIDNRQTRLEVNLAIAQELLIAQGYASDRLQTAFLEARELASTVGSEREYFACLWGRWRMEYNKAEFELSLTTAGELKNLALRLNDPYFLTGANTSLAVSSYWLGKLEDSLSFSEEAMSFDDSDASAEYVHLFSVIPSVMNRAFRQTALFASGRLAEGIALGLRIDESLQQLDHMPSLVFGFFYRGVASMQLGDHKAGKISLERVVEISEKHHFPHWRALADFQLSRVSAAMGELEESLTAMENAQARIEKLGVKISETPCLLGRAGILRQLGRKKESYTVLEQAGTTAPILYPEVLRQRAGLLTEDQPLKAAEHLLASAELATEQSSLIVAMMSACALARLQMATDGTIGCRELLDGIYNAISKDVELPMFEQARQLLEEESTTQRSSLQDNQ